MAIQWQTIELPAGGGIDTKTDPKLLKAPAVEDIQNIVFTDAPGWKKRNGYTALGRDIVGSSDDLTTGKALGAFNDELLLFDDNYLYSYSQGMTEWKQVNRVLGPQTTFRKLTDLPINQTQVDSAVTNGIRVTVWLSSSDSLVHYEVRDDNTGALLVSDTSISNSVSGKVCSNNNTIHIVYHNCQIVGWNTV